MRLISEINGIEDLIVDLNEISAGLDDDEEAMKAIGLIGLRRSQTSFLTQSWDKSPWAKLKPRTERRRRNKDKGSIQILRDTGLLMQSLSEAGEYSIWELGNHRVRWGSNRPGAVAHQDGYAEGNIPQRQFAGWTDQDLADYQEAYLDTVLGFGGSSNAK